MSETLVSGTTIRTADVCGRLYPGLGEGPHPVVLVPHGDRCFPDAGHAIRVPYRSASDAAPDETHRFGGTHEANATAAARAWRTALEYLERL